MEEKIQNEQQKQHQMLLNPLLNQSQNSITFTPQISVTSNGGVVGSGGSVGGAHLNNSHFTNLSYSNTSNEVNGPVYYGTQISYSNILQNNQNNSLFHHQHSFNHHHHQPNPSVSLLNANIHNFSESILSSKSVPTTPTKNYMNGSSMHVNFNLTPAKISNGVGGHVVGGLGLMNLNESSGGVGGSNTMFGMCLSPTATTSVTMASN
jgi:hypothetical protein